MDFQRTWANADCAAGFATACTKLSYIAAAGGGCYRVHDIATVAIAAAQNAEAMLLNEAPADSFIQRASSAANEVAMRAAKGRACHTELTKLYVQWALKDLIGDRDIDAFIRQAAGAAIAGGNEVIALELLTDE